jgi:hypothetical protein
MVSTLWVVAALNCLPLGASEDRGVHQRLSTAAGPIHLWCREGSTPTETVIFVHGHELDADTVYRQDALAEQFYSSGRNALFVVPEAPLGPNDPVRWTAIEALFDAVDQGSGVHAPRSVIVAGHSGAYRTIAPWLRSKLVTRVVLIDAFYGDMVEYDDWLQRDDARLMVLSSLTFPRADAFVQALDEPRRKRVKHEKTTLGHWELVSGGTTLSRVIAEQPMMGDSRS